MAIEFKKVLSIFFAQFLLIALLCVNIRAVSDGNYIPAITTDIIIASFKFYILREIVKEPDRFDLFAGYILGSALGSALGIKISLMLSQ